MQTIYNKHYEWFCSSYAWGLPYTANMNDAEIIKIVSSKPNGLIKLLKKDDIIIVDRGFRDLTEY